MSNEVNKSNKNKKKAKIYDILINSLSTILKNRKSNNLLSNIKRMQMCVYVELNEAENGLLVYLRNFNYCANIRYVNQMKSN